MGWHGKVRTLSLTVWGEPGPRGPEGWTKGSGSPWEPLWPNPQPLVCTSFPPSSPLSRPSPLTIHRPKLLHVRSGQDLFVERLRLSIFTLFQVTGSLGQEGRNTGARDRDNLSARLRDFYFVFSFMTFPRDPPHISFSSYGSRVFPLHPKRLQDFCFPLE